MTAKVKEKAKANAPGIPPDAIFTIKMRLPRIINKIRATVGATVEVFASDAERLVRDKHAVYDPPLDVQQEALAEAK